MDGIAQPLDRQVVRWHLGHAGHVRKQILLDGGARRRSGLRPSEVIERPVAQHHQLALDVGMTPLAVGGGEDVDGLEQLPAGDEGIRSAQRGRNVSLRAAEAEAHLGSIRQRALPEKTAIQRQAVPAGCMESGRACSPRAPGNPRALTIAERKA